MSINFNALPSDAPRRGHAHISTKCHKSQKNQSLAEAMSEAGIDCPGYIEPDGKIHRFGKNQNQWAILHQNPDGSQGSAFGDWSTGVSETWFSGGSADADFRQHLEIVRQFHDEEARERQAKAKARAADLWAKAQPAGDHPYLARKGVKVPGLRAMGAALVAPAMDAEGNIQSLQFIQADGSKRFLKGAPTAGVSFNIHGTEPGTIAICEGLATGGSVHAATGWTVVCSFSAGNLKSVCEQVRGKFPNARIIIAGDHDESQAGERYGRAAAEAVGGRFVMPETMGHDWNDVHIGKGLEAVRAGLEGAGGGHIFARITADPLAFIAKRWLDTEPPPLEYVIEGVLLRKSLCMISGQGGVGKTTLLQELCISWACGESIIPALGPSGFGLKILFLTCEDSEAILHRRFKKIADHFFPDDTDAREDIGRNITIASLAGNDVRLLTTDAKGNAIPSDHFHGLMGLVKKMKPDLVVLDPLSRLYGQDENSNPNATVFCSMLEKLADESGAAVILVHHVRKGSGMVGGKFVLDAALDAETSRGASAFHGAVRAMINVCSIPESKSKEFVKDPNPGPGRYLAVKVSKSNYGPPSNPFFLERVNGGVLVPAIAREENARDQDQVLKEKILVFVRAHNGEFTKNAIASGNFKKWKSEGIKSSSRDGILAAIQELIFTGELAVDYRKNPKGRMTEYVLEPTIPDPFYTSDYTSDATLPNTSEKKPEVRKSNNSNELTLPKMDTSEKASGSIQAIENIELSHFRNSSPKGEEAHPEVCPSSLGDLGAGTLPEGWEEV